MDNAKELIKVKEELIETKTELIRKIEMCQELHTTIRDLNGVKEVLTDMHTRTRGLLRQDRKKLIILHNDIQSIGRRISIKDLEAFKQKCAEIYGETPTA